MSVEKSNEWPPGLEDLLDKTFDELTDEEHERLTWAIIQDQFKKDLPDKCRSIEDVEAWLDELRAWSMAETSHVEALKRDVYESIDTFNDNFKILGKHVKGLLEIVDALADRVIALEKKAAKRG